MCSRGRTRETRDRFDTVDGKICGHHNGICGTIVGLRFGIIQRVVQAPAFAARQRAADDQLGHRHQVAQFNQVIVDYEIAVVIANFFLQQFFLQEL